MNRAMPKAHVVTRNRVSPSRSDGETLFRASHPTTLIRAQDVREDGGAAAANVLGHADLGLVEHLGVAGFPAQLLHHFNDLIDAGGAHGMAAGLEPSARGDRHPPL